MDAAVNAYNQGRLAAAEELSRQALNEAQTLGPQHPATGVSLLTLGKVYRSQGRYDEAEALLKQALPGMEKNYPQDLPLPSTLAELAVIYDFQGKYLLAETLYSRALAMFQKIVGLGHPQAAQVLDNVRSLYRDQGKYAEAVRVAEIWIPILLKDEIQEKIPRVASDGFVQTGELYVAQGRYAQAEQLVKRAVALREKVHGSGHPVVVTTMNYLSFIYRAQAKHNEAEVIARQALTTSEKVLGPDHPSVAQSLSALAAVYEAQGKYTDAEPFYKRALEIWQKAFGEDDLQVAQGLGDYSRVLKKMNRDAEAERLEARAKAARAKYAGAKSDKWPIEIKDGPCRISVLPWTPDRINFLIQGLGFEPN
ncbi:MAG: tetratricopeptide repeat protein, partial [Deltaproteobacteria bacterium]|nr:tetratricopeptide repeat protein [Deltaproteobacteria bacterium]